MTFQLITLNAFCTALTWVSWIFLGPSRFGGVELVYQSVFVTHLITTLALVRGQIFSVLASGLATLVALSICYWLNWPPTGGAYVGMIIGMRIIFSSFTGALGLLVSLYLHEIHDFQIGAKVAFNLLTCFTAVWIVVIFFGIDALRETLSR